MSATFGVDFGQKVDLTASIRNILRNYPEGTAVLKELVQNADDAGASTVVFYLDYRHHGTDKLADAALVPFQGPSLLVYNDAVFTAEDFNSIQRIGDSLKKSSEDSRAKIGRFGIGFNAVYHWTDLPSFISSNYLVMLDPQARFLPNVNPSNPGKMVDWIATPNIVTQMPDQFRPYEIEGMDWAKPLKGTLFRLPLRTAAQAKTSLLSKRALSVEDAAVLLEALRVEASAMLLFLKTVTKIEIREWKDGADLKGGKTQSTVLFSCQATNTTADMMKKRCLVSDKQLLQSVAGNSELAVTADYALNIQCTSRHLSTPYVEHWEICNQLGGRGASHIASDPDNALLRLIPWAGVAACVSVTNSGASGGDVSPTSANGADTASAARDGLAYCFLPLPVRTGLPVMVNGFFELSSNRRDVWQAGADMTGDGRTRALWNISLMKDLISPSYARLLLRLRDILGFSEQYQQLWPNIRAAGTPWDEVVRATLALSKDNKLLKVVTAADMTSTTMPGQKADCTASSVVTTKTGSIFGGFGKKSADKSDASQWISCAAAVLLPLGYTIATDTTTAAHNAADATELTAYLVRAQAPLVLCLEALKVTLIETASCTSTATPAYVRSVLRGPSTVIGAANVVPTPEMCKFLLKYCMSDLSFSSGANMIAATATALDGLPLLPLSDSTVTVLRIFSTTQVAAIAEVNSMGFSLSQTVSALSSTRFSTADACDLLANAADSQGRSNTVKITLNSILLLLDEPQLKVFSAAAPVLLNKENIAPNEVDILCHSSTQKHSNVRTFQPQFIPDLLSFILPPECLRGKRTTREELKPEVFEKMVSFLKIFWSYAATRGDVVSAVKEGAALVPVIGLQAFYPLSRMSNLLVQRKGDVALDGAVVEILQLLGVQIVDQLALHEGAMMPAVFWEYVLSPTRSGVLTALDFVLRSAPIAAGSTAGTSGSAVFAQLSAAQRETLRHYLATVEPVKHLTDKECSIVRNLPIFATFQRNKADAAAYAHTAIGDRFGPTAARTGTTTGTRTPFASVTTYDHLPEAILSAHLLRHTSPQDLQLLAHLQVQVLNRAQFFRNEFLPHVAAFYYVQPAEVVSTVLVMLDEVKVLSESDKEFLNLLRATAFIPCAAPTPVVHTANSPELSGEDSPGPGGFPGFGTATKLSKACELFDPTDKELVALLDPQWFPNTDLIPLLQRADLLALLRSIGLQGSLTWPSLVACARSIAEMSERVTVNGASTPNEHKTVRATSLLRFLDKNISRLMAEEKKDGGKDRKGGDGSHGSHSGGKSLFSFGSLFGGSSSQQGSGIKEPTQSAPAAEQAMEVYMDQLKYIAWLPVAITAPHVCMPWPEYLDAGTDSKLPSPAPARVSALSLTASPVDTASIKDAWLVSATKRLVIEPVHTPALQRLLGWQDTYPVQIIAIQLRELSARYLKLCPRCDSAAPSLAVTAASGADHDVALTAKAEVQRLRETITGLIPQLYQRLNASATSVSSSGSNGSVSPHHEILSILESSAWIWVGDVFVTIDKVALNAGVNAAPYLYQLPQDLQVYGAILAVFQVKQRFNNRDYIEALRQMAVETGAVSQSNGAAARALSDARLDICISLVTLLATESSANSSLSTLSQNIFLPDNQGKLALAESLINDDVPWLSGPEYISVRAGCRLVHPNISSKVATTLGVKSLRLSLLNKSLEQNIFAMPSEATVESFGQAESLTNRLKTILDMYPDGNPIFSELIQNADDAGASIVSILLDENTYSCESLLDSKMAALQGPSLVVRNNAMFTEADFKSLAKIGQGSKLDKLATTGRFGLGFNSTYHLTDTPSFVSGDHIVIFDPHCNYVPGATTNQPGVRIRFVGSTLSATFRDQFEPFHFFGCDVTNKFSGTLFRFPLRTATQARKSEISKRSYTVDDMEANLEQLSGQLSNMLIFLRNVRCIDVYRCVAGTKTPALLHRATSTVSGVEKVNDQFLLSFFDKNDGNNGTNALSRDGFYKRLMATADNALPKVFSQVHIDTEAFALPAPIVATAPKSITVGAEGNGTGITTLTPPIGQLAGDAQVVVASAAVDYVVASGLCGGDAKRMACLEDLRHFKLVPMGAVAACVSRTAVGDTSNNTSEAVVTAADGPAVEEPADSVVLGDDYPQLQGVAFCYLPLPVLTQLPVHCNAYFELSSNRRDIWKGDDTKGEAKMRSDWNVCVMKDVLAPLYAMLLNKMHVRAQAVTKQRNNTANLSVQQLQNMQQHLHYRLLSLLPCPTPHEPWNNIATALFSCIAADKLFYSEIGGGAFVPLKDAYIMQRALLDDEDSVKQKLEQLLLLENIPVVRAPAVVVQALVTSKAVACEVNPALVRSLFHVSNARRHPTLGTNGQSSKQSAPVLNTVLSEEQLGNAVFWLQYCFQDIGGGAQQSGRSGVNSVGSARQLEQLVGLHLLPLENNTLGTLDHATDAPPFFIVNDVERRLLSRAGQSIVASEQLLGQKVSAVLKSDAFLHVCNVRTITVVDTLKLISTILPQQWMAASTVFANRIQTNNRSTSNTNGIEESTTIVSKEWLLSLWGYIIENKCIDMFREMFPILPVVYPNSLPEGEYLVKVSSATPVLHMTYREIKADTVGILAQLGVFICDSTVLGGKSFSAEITDLLSPPTARGVLDALILRVQHLHKNHVLLDALLTPDPTVRSALQNFVLDSVLGKLDVLTGNDITVLGALPIWSTYSSLNAAASQVRCAELDIETTQLPPVGCTAELEGLLGSSYVRLRHERDRTLYLKLGVREPTMGAFYANYVVPKIIQKAVPPNQMDAITVSMLRNLPQLEREHPGLTTQLSTCAIVRCEEASASLLAPVDLYDPQAALLPSFMPSQLFPSSTIFGDPALLHSLRQLGLRTSVSAEGVLTAARAIQKDFESALTAPPTTVGPAAATTTIGGTAPTSKEEKVEKITLRAAGLMSYLEKYVGELLMECSPESVYAFDREHSQDNTTASDNSTAAHTPATSPMGGAWGAELRSITWVPVHTSPPSRVVHADLVLPWPVRTHATAIAAPSQCNSLSNVWLCSSSHRICSADTSKAELLEYVLGWDKPIAGRNIAMQLLGLRQAYDAAAEKLNFSAHSANEIYQAIVPTLLQQLQLAFNRESPAEIKLWVDALRGKAIIWMQSRFIETSRLAFNSMTNLNTEPFLFIARPELVRYKALLLELGAREAFEAADLAVLTRDLYASHRTTPLSTFKLTLCVGIVQLLQKMIAGEEIIAESAENADMAMEESDSNDAQSGNSGPVVPVAQLVPDGDGDASSGSAGVVNMPPPPPPQRRSEKVVIKTKKVSLAELGTIYLPDAQRYLQPSTTLTFDDAPWMSGALHQQQMQNNIQGQQSPSMIRFVHSHVETTVAMSLGCKSLREQLFTGEDVHCPDVEALHSTLDDDDLRDTLIDLLYVADACGSMRLHLVYDDRRHPSESLLHPGLADAQGPALVAYLDGARPFNRETMAMLMSIQSMGSEAFGAEPTNSNSPVAALKGKFRKATGKKLLTTFSVTDCLQVLSGNEFYIFDPCGKYLLSAGGAGDASNNTAPEETGGRRLQSKLQRKSTSQSMVRSAAASRAQHYVINKNSRSGAAGTDAGATQDALDRFPDQFASFLSLPFGFRHQLQRSGRINGVVIRMPLRREISIISDFVASVESIKSNFGALRAVACGSLAFADTLMEVRMSHCYDSSGEKSDVVNGKDDSTPAEKVSAAGKTTTPTVPAVPDLVLDIAVKMLTPSSNRKSRHSITADKGWNKQGFSKIFAKAFVPPEAMYTMIIETELLCKDVWINPTPQLLSIMTQLLAEQNSESSFRVHAEDWLIAAISGYGKLRDLALMEPYLSLDMQPFVTIAAPILSAAQLLDISTPPDAGMYFCSAAAVGTTGLPFHVEGSFMLPHAPLQLSKTPSVRFPVTGPSPTKAVSFPHVSPNDILTVQNWTDALLYTVTDILYPKILFEIKAQVETMAKQLSTTGATGQNANNSTSRKVRLMSGFYKYFPYSPRLSQAALKVLNSTTVWSNFAQNPIFLQQSGFQYLHESMLPTKLLPPAVSAYILPILPLAFCPQQLTVDLTAARVAVVPALTAGKLRQTLAANALMHCSRLANNPSLVLSLLRFVLEDISDKSRSEGEYTRKRLFRELAGVPLMPLANLNVKPFPRDASEQVAIAPVILHALLPALKNSFLHPTLTAALPLFSDPLFLETLFISHFNASFMEHNIAHIVPAKWRRASAVEWLPAGALTSAGVGSAARSVRPTGADSGFNAPSPLLMYIIWNSFLSQETSWTEIEKLKEYPMIPVISKNRQLLLSMSLLSVVFSDRSSEQQDEARIYLKREIGRAASLAHSAMGALPDGTTVDEVVTDDWAWTTLPASSRVAKSSRAVAASDRRGSTSSAAASNDSDDDIGDNTIIEADYIDAGNGSAGTGPATLTAMQVSAVPVDAVDATEEAFEPNFPGSGPSSAAPVRTSPNQPSAGSAGSNETVRRILRTLGLPFLDAGVFENIPQIIRENTTAGGQTGGAADMSGRRILQCLHKLDSLNIFVQSLPAGAATLAATPGAPLPMFPSEPLLCYDDLSVQDRNALLVLMSAQHHQLMAPLNAQEQTQIKQLRLFTSKVDNSAVSIDGCRGGVYWCTENSVLDTIANRDTRTTNTAAAGGSGVQQEAPVILIFEPALRELYQLLRVEELTAATAVRKFTVPQLRHMAPLARLKAMLGLAAQWSSYRSDEALVQQLADVPFIPPYSAVSMDTQSSASVSTSSLTLECCEGTDIATLRRAKDLFLWTNDELLDALKGPKQCLYFAPPYLRTATMHVMCQDLGMQKDLTEDTFRRILMDIEAMVNDSLSGHGDADLQREAAERGRGILRYVKTDDRISTLLQNKTFATSVGKIRFVPMRLPVSTEPGGYVTYREEVGRFDQLLSRNHGALAFTVMPIIDEDITPPQYYSSALGITGSPSAEVVLRHVRNLTSHGESLDRWNAPYTITATFNAIFQYLSDNWKSLSPNVRASLSGVNLVPVGHMLIKPTRLFFRLAEDLSPFMHEIPRLYGAHEQFLKQIGIKESPTVADYVRFLSDLAYECGDCSMNPNELRAVVAILQVIATQSGEAADVSEAQSASNTPDSSANGKVTAVERKSRATELGKLFVPDERSVMRVITQCLVNDNEWFRGNVCVQLQLEQAGLFLLHPCINAHVASLLQVDTLSSVVTEVLVTDDWSSDGADSVSLNEQLQLQDHFRTTLTDSSFINALVTLLRSKEQRTGDGSSELSSGQPRNFAALREALLALTFKFVNELKTKFCLTYTTSKGAVNSVEFADQTSRQRLSYLAKGADDTESHDLFVNLMMAAAPLNLNLAVAAGLCQRVGADLSLSYAVAALMESADVQHMTLVLESLNIHLGTQRHEAGEGSAASSTVVNNFARGVPGERVTAEDALLLELRPFRVYRVGEIVAYELPIPRESASSEADSGIKATNQSTDAKEATTAPLNVKVYAKVISVGTVSDEGIRRLNVKIGSSAVVSVLSTDIFSFKSARDHNATKAAAAAASGALRMPFFGSSAPKKGTIATPQAGANSKLSATGTSGSSQNAAGGGEDENIGRSELLGAVSGLLARAGVPIDMEQQSLIAHILELEGAKKRIEKELAAERQQLMQSKEQIEASSALLKCSICVTHDVYYVLTPCGHTICEQCIDMWRGAGCPICRTRMQSKVRFYLPGSGDV